MATGTMKRIHYERDQDFGGPMQLDRREHYEERQLDMMRHMKRNYNNAIKNQKSSNLNCMTVVHDEYPVETRSSTCSPTDSEGERNSRPATTSDLYVNDVVRSARKTDFIVKQKIKAAKYGGSGSEGVGGIGIHGDFGDFPDGFVKEKQRIKDMYFSKVYQSPHYGPQLRPAPSIHADPPLTTTTTQAMHQPPHTPTRRPQSDRQYVPSFDEDSIGGVASLSDALATNNECSDAVMSDTPPPYEGTYYEYPPLSSPQVSRHDERLSNKNNKFHITSLGGSLRRSVRPTLKKKKGNGGKEKTQKKELNGQIDSTSVPSDASAKLKELKHNYESVRNAQYNQWSKRNTHYDHSNNVNNNNYDDNNNNRGFYRRTEKPTCAFRQQRRATDKGRGERDAEDEAPPMSFRQSLRHYEPRNDGPVSGEDIRRITERYERMKLKKRLTAKGGKWLNASNEGRNEGRKKKCQACCPEPDESLCNNKNRTNNNQQRETSSNESSGNNPNNHNDNNSNNYLKGNTNRNTFTKSNKTLNTKSTTTYVSPYNQKRMRGQRAKKAADVTTTATSGEAEGEKKYTSVGCSPIQTEEWMKLQQNDEDEEVKDVISVHVIPKVKKHRRRKKPKSKSFSERELSALQSKKLNEIKGKYESILNNNVNNNNCNNNREDESGVEQHSASDSEYSYTGSSETSEESDISSPEYPDDPDYQDVDGEYVRSLCVEEREEEEEEEEGEEGRIMEELKMKYSESRVEDVVREEVQRNNAKVRYKIAKCSEEQEERMRKMKNKYDAMVQQYAPGGGGDECGDCGGDDCGCCGGGGSDKNDRGDDSRGGPSGGRDSHGGKSSNRDTIYPEQYAYEDDFEDYEDDFEDGDEPPYHVSSFQRTNSWVCNNSCQDESTDATI